MATEVVNEDARRRDVRLRWPAPRVGNTGRRGKRRPRHPAIAQLRLAILLNFKFADLRWKRVIR